jgi:hypothetical protein
LRIGKLLVALYERGDPAGRGADRRVRRRMQWGVWQAARRSTKLAEARRAAVVACSRIRPAQSPRRS